MIRLAVSVEGRAEREFIRRVLVLYPRDSQEKRLLDAMLLAASR